MENRLQLSFSKCFRFAVLICLLAALIGISPVKTASAADTGHYYYTVTTGDPAVYTDMAGGTPVPMTDYTLSTAIPIGFDFYFFNSPTPYTSAYICGNGVLQFTGAVACGVASTPIPSASNPDPLIAAWWGDLDPAVPGGTIQYLTTGTQPNRVFTVEFKDVSHFNYADPTEKTPLNPVSFKIVLYETTNIIEVYYRAAPASDQGRANIIYHAAGIEGSATSGLQYFYSQDAMTTPVMVRYQQDTVAPNTSLTGTLPGSPTNLTSASFSFTGTDDHAGVTFRCQLDAQAPEDNCLSPKSYNDLSDGSHTFTVTAIDAAGNPDPTPATHTWVIDATGPVITVGTKPNLVTNQTTATFAFSATDAHTPVTFKCKDWQTDWAACTSPKTYTGLTTDGQYTFQLSATDSLGNTTTNPAYTWIVDTKAPAVPVLTSPKDNVKTGTSVTLKWSASADVGGGSASSYLIVIDDGAPTEVIGALQKDITGLTPGSHTWKAAAKDAAGNISAYSSPAAFTAVTYIYLPIVLR